MQSQLANAIEKEAKKRLQRQRHSQQRSRDYRVRFQKRTGILPLCPSTSNDQLVEVHQHYNPIYCIRHRKHLAHCIWRSLGENSYIPTPSVVVSLPKAGSTNKREVHIFSIPDAALSNLLATRIIRRNEAVFSHGNYAYRSGRKALDGVVQLDRVCKHNRLYVVQCDFSSYFDSIEHRYLLQKINDRTFLLRLRERNYISSIITHSFAPMKTYATSTQRKCGVPQGLSISLFLANAASHDLDVVLDRLNGVFARFADDIVLATFSYEDAVRAFDAVHEHCAKAGLSLNPEKTQGVSMLSLNEEELRTIDSFDFLGYSFTPTGLQLASRTIARIKRHVSTIIYRHLLLYPNRKQFSTKRIGSGFVDWDLVTCVNEIRRYIYGGIPEASINDHLTHKTKLRAGHGPFSYFCLANNHSQLHELDGWVVDAVYRAFRKRARLIQKLGHHPNKTSIAKPELVSGAWFNAPLQQETALPSFYRAWRSGRKVWFSDGGARVSLPPEAYVP